MKRVLSVFSILIITVVCFISASAHPGRTDSNGGHWNHDTGEYHYHDGSSSGKAHTNTEKSDEQDFFLWFVKTSPSYNWELSDIIHLIITFVVIGFLIYVFSSERSIVFTIAFIILALSAIVFSISLNFSEPSKESFFDAWLSGVIFTIIIYPLLVGGTYTTLSDFNLL